MAATAITIGPAFLYGRYTNRWGQTTELARAAELLDQLPNEFGSWKQISKNQPLPKRVFMELGLAAEIGRQFIDRETGESVGLLLLVGRPGRLVRHPPEICYANRANSQIGDARSILLDQPADDHEFRLLEYQRDRAGIGERFFVAYGFTVDGSVWKAPPAPRLQYGGKSRLYKLQVLSVPLGVDDATSAASIKKFIREFVKAFPAVVPEAIDNESKEPF